MGSTAMRGKLSCVANETNVGPVMGHTNILSDV